MSGERRALCLVGLRCSGKSSVGRVLARRLGVPFRDLDEELTWEWAREEGLAPAAGPAAGELLARIGLGAFRDLEERCLAGLLSGGPAQVIATGAGCVETAAVRELLRERGRCVWLAASVPELRRRLRDDPTPRPSIEGLEGQRGGDATDEMPRLAARREPLYRAVASFVVDSGRGDVDAVAERVLSQLESSDGESAHSGG